MQYLFGLRKFFYVGVLMIALLSGCNITYKVRNQHGDITYIQHLPCGRVTYELIGKGNSKFMIKQRFDLDSDIQIFPDLLELHYNDNIIEAIQDLKKSIKNHEFITVSGRKSMQTAFEFDKGVFEGDTILVYGKGYMKCNNEVISMDTLIFSFINNLRIHGVNDF